MMSDEQGLLLRVLCLVAGYVFGCFPCADVAARCVAGAPLRFVGDGSSRTSNIRRYLGKTAVAGVVTGNVLKTWLSCWFCYKLAAPELEYAAMLYAGFGVLLGHSWPLVGNHRGGQGGVVVWAWVAACLPVSGILCVLAGAVVALGTECGVLGALAVPLLAVLVAWLQYGAPSAGLMLAAALIVAWQYRAELAQTCTGDGKGPIRRFFLH